MGFTSSLHRFLQNNTLTPTSTCNILQPIHLHLVRLVIVDSSKYFMCLLIKLCIQYNLCCNTYQFFTKWVCVTMCIASIEFSQMQIFEIYAHFPPCRTVSQMAFNFIFVQKFSCARTYVCCEF